jgi:hypothetical protein
MNNYRWITLTSRHIDCSNITEDEFVLAMFSDLLEAQEKYNELYIPEWEAYKVKSFNDRMVWVRNWATKIAEKKWKTEKKRNEYINKETEAARKRYNRDAYYYGLSFFDFDVHPESNGLSGDCCLSIDHLTFKSLERCFESVKDNYYFKNATGWELKYECHENNHSVSFRPYIELIMPEKVKAEYEQAQKDLAESIRKFYEGCHYFGD